MIRFFTGKVVLIGDHNQLPPVVTNMAFQRYAKMDQSLLSRFVRLGVPPTTLDAQGRMRPSLAALWNWRYKTLANLPNVIEDPTYSHANAGYVIDIYPCYLHNNNINIYERS